MNYYVFLVILFAAAGVAAAIMAENGSDNRIDVNLLKESLKKLGAIVP